MAGRRLPSFTQVSERCRVDGSIGKVRRATQAKLEQREICRQRAFGRLIHYRSFFCSDGGSRYQVLSVFVMPPAPNSDEGLQ